MASLGHIAVGMAAARLYRRGLPPRFSIVTSMALWSFLSLLPDGDVVGFRFGIAYEDPLGHRGATHSLVFSLLGAALVGLIARAVKAASVRHFSAEGLRVAATELVLFAPFFLYALWPRRPPGLDARDRLS